jgi:hypothetical protein
MSSNQLLKLVFFHDQRMEELASSSSDSSKVDSDVLSLFIKPDPTYSRLFFMGSDLANNRYGINLLDAYPSVVTIIEKLYNLPLKREWANEKGIGDWMQNAPMDAYLRLVRKSKDRITTQVNGLDTSFTKDIPATDNKNLEQAWGYEVEASVIHQLLMKDEVILVKRAAIDGYDIDLYSKRNPYIDFFYPLQSLLPDAFRFFSINGKRVHSKEALYFEKTRLYKPPHGFEEVHPESVL